MENFEHYHCGICEEPYPTMEEADRCFEEHDYKLQNDFLKERCENQSETINDLIKDINEAIEYIEKQIPIVKINLNMTNINTAASELLNYEKLLEMLKGEGNE